MGSNCTYSHQKKPVKKWAKHPSALADAGISTAEAMSQAENAPLDAALNNQEDGGIVLDKATEVTVSSAMEEIQPKLHI
jgi:hypothetical protein